VTNHIHPIKIYYIQRSKTRYVLVDLFYTGPSYMMPCKIMSSKTLVAFQSHWLWVGTTVG